MAKKKFIFIIVMVVLLAGLSLTLVLLRREEPAPPAPMADLPPVEYIIDYYADEFAGLASVYLKNEKGEFRIIAGTPPSIPGWESLISNTYPLTRIVDICRSLVSRGLVVEEGADLSIYGLDPSRAQVEIKTNSGEGTTLYIGNDAPDRSSTYVRLEGRPQVYQAGKWEIDSLLQGVFDFVDREVSPQLADDGYGGFAFSEITLGGTARPDGIVRIVYKDPGEATGRISNPYQIISPIEEPLNQDKGMTTLKTIPGIQADAVAGRILDPVDLVPYGLDRPYSTAAISGTLGQGLGGFSLRASRPDAFDNVYIFREGSELVYQVAASNIPWLSATWWDLMDKMLILPFIDDVARVELISPQRQTAFTLSGEGDELKVESQGAVLNTDDFRKYYQTLLSAVYDEYTEERIPPGASPVLEIVYRYRDGRTPDRISFYAAGNRRVLSSLNGRRPFYTYSAYTDKVLIDLDQILAGKKVQSYL
ncbi:MAG: DUF4340 domain-containing protein [Treponema sp.]|jgi:hypothetical protein|nr:DUF4340 domain-containing protein [Treponema sp.]